MKRDFRPSLEEEENKARALLSRAFTASLLNNTKWRELTTSLETLPVSYRVKFIDVDQPLVGNLMHRTDRFYDSPWGAVPILSVEWLDIYPIQEIHQGNLLSPKVVDHSSEVIRRLNTLNIEPKIVGEYIRVVGHVRRDHIQQ